MIRFFALGIPIEQGSKDRGRHGQMYEHKSKELAAWRRTVAIMCQAERGSPYLWLGPVGLRATFFFPRPKRGKDRGVFKTTKPDTDKLVRAIGDALTGILFKDDSQVACLGECFKVWTTGEPGALITAWELEAEDERKIVE